MTELGRGVEEGASNIAPAADSSIEVIRQISSTGFLRNRLPENWDSLASGVSTDAVNVASTSTEVKIETQSLSAAAGGSAIDARTKAKMQGYEGDPCGECQNFTLVRNGTCMKCNTCGSTTGCS